MPARREGSTFKDLDCFSKTEKKLKKVLKSACQLVEITVKLPLLCLVELVIVKHGDFFCENKCSFTIWIR